MGPAALGSQNWKMHPEPRQQSWHSRGEKSFLPGACPCKKQIGFYSGPCEGRKSATLGSSLPKAFPLGEASGSCNPTQKKRPKSGHVHGHRNSPSTGTPRLPTPKPASGNERALKKGGGGGPPPRLFASGLSLEKAWIPARDRAETHVAGLDLRRSQTGPPAGGRAPHPAPVSAFSTAF